MPPKRATSSKRRRRVEDDGSQDLEPLLLAEVSAIPGHRWRPSVQANRKSPMLTAGKTVAAGGPAATASGLGFTGGQAELLVVRCGLAVAVWTTLAVDLSKRRHRAWSYLYTHWNLLLFAGYSAAAFLSSLLAGHVEHLPQHESVSLRLGRWAAQLVSLLFPLLATTHVFLDLGYFLFLHGRLAARGGWPGGWQYLLGGMGPTAVSKHLLNSVRVHKQVIHTEIKLISSTTPYLPPRTVHKIYSFGLQASLGSAA